MREFKNKQSYSDRALEAAVKGVVRGSDAWWIDDAVEEAMTAAHDRERLGLEASVHAASYRAEVIEEVAAWLRLHQVTIAPALVGAPRISAADVLLREFGAIVDQ